MPFSSIAKSKSKNGGNSGEFDKNIINNSNNRANYSQNVPDELGERLDPRYSETIKLDRDRLSLSCSISPNSLSKCQSELPFNNNKSAMANTNKINLEKTSGNRLLGSQNDGPPPSQSSLPAPSTISQSPFLPSSSLRIKMIDLIFPGRKLRSLVMVFIFIHTMRLLYEIEFNSPEYYPSTTHQLSEQQPSNSDHLYLSLFSFLSSQLASQGRDQSYTKSASSSFFRRPLITGVSAFDKLERIKLRDEAKQMFYHAYYSYINTYPADEILPISCRGRFRQDSNDIDESIGNFSLTMVDSLDTLVMMGDIDEFEIAVKKIIKDLSFDTDIVVSVFETNIRMLGGLLSAHILAKSIQDRTDRSIRYFNATTRRQLDWYDSEILNLAEDLGRRLLPAFDTKTGIPHPRVNLKYGMESNDLRSVQETCTACAGSLILEFATLSRLTGDNVFEDKARQALDSLWDHRHRSTDLVGTVLNVDSGEWVRRESGVGAGSDSYYEYLMKAYILLGDSTYLHRFNRHYSSVMRYISRGPFLMDVHMHRPNRIAKGFMDALSAFWPGLQVLKGDLRSAIATHSMFNEVIRRHSYLPEAFTTDLQVYWANHQMRPEFLESTFFLHRATQEDYYLEIGKEILKKLQDLKVDCGFAGLKDVRTGVHDDKMSSFVLAETLKYLYLLFSNDNETHVDLDRFIFSTEGHLLPIELGLMNTTPPKVADGDNERTSRSNNEGLESSSETSSYFGFHTSSANNKKSSVHTGEEDKKQQSVRAEVARLLIRMSDRFNQDRSVINLGNYETSCPSLEAQEMRFDSKYHPFLNKRIGVSELLETTEQISQMQLLEKIKEFTASDPDFIKLATSLGLALSVQPNGIVKLTVNPKPSSSEGDEINFGQRDDNSNSNQCML